MNPRLTAIFRVLSITILWSILCAVGLQTNNFMLHVILTLTGLMSSVFIATRKQHTDQVAAKKFERLKKAA